MTGSGTLTNEGRRVRLRLALMLVGLVVVPGLVRTALLVIGLGPIPERGGVFVNASELPETTWVDHVPTAIFLAIVVSALVLAWGAWTSRARWVRLLCRRLFP